METQSPPFKRIKHQPQRRGFNAAADSHASTPRQLNLDHIEGRCRRRCNRPTGRHHDWHELRRRGSYHPVAVELAPSENQMGFTSYCRATTDTDAPGTNAADTISRLSASGHVRRLTRLIVSIIALVDTCRPVVVPRAGRMRLIHKPGQAVLTVGLPYVVRAGWKCVMGLINIGDIVLDGFEVPSRVEFGGKQRLVVHKLIGGIRVIDALVRDDAALKWHGILSGADASDRARTLDAIRAAGSSQLLTWDAFCYDVVISELRLSFCSPWWIPYEITCTVQQDLAQGLAIDEPTVISSVIDDLTEASQLFGSITALNPTSISSLLSAGATGQQQALALTTGYQTEVMQGIANAELGFQSNYVGSLVSSAGSLAQLCCAQGYLDRCTTNIINAD